MPKVAKLSGSALSVINVAPGVEYHLTNPIDEETELTTGDVRVTPFVFGKFVNANAFTIPEVVVEELKRLIVTK